MSSALSITGWLLDFQPSHPFSIKEQEKGRGDAKSSVLLSKKLLGIYPSVIGTYILLVRVSYLAARNEGRWEFVEQKTSFRQGVRRSVGICPSEKGNRMFQEEAAAGAKMCTYKGAYAFGDSEWVWLA